MSSSCTCHIDIDSCIWCRIQVLKGVIDNYEDCTRVVITRPKELIEDFYWLFEVIEQQQAEIDRLIAEREATNVIRVGGVEINPQDLTSICLSCGIDLGKCICDKSDKKENPFFKGYKPTQFFKLE